MSTSELSNIVDDFHKLAKWELSPQGQAYWQDFLRRLAQYAKPPNNRDLSILQHNPEYPYYANNTHWINLVSPKFHATINLQKICNHAFLLNEHLHYSNTYEAHFYPGAKTGGYWYERYYFLSNLQNLRFWRSASVPGYDNALQH